MSEPGAITLRRLCLLRLHLSPLVETWTKNVARSIGKWDNDWKETSKLVADWLFWSVDTSPQSLDYALIRQRMHYFMITKKVAQSIDSSVLCWLATVAPDGSPNVSPKEAFMHDGNGRIIVAHIASPQTVRNIEREPRVCLSFIDIFTQVGHKVRGTAKILRESDERFSEQMSLLTQLIGASFPILAVIEVVPTEIEELIAPSYRMIPGTTTTKSIQQTMATYKVTEYLDSL